VPQFDLYIQSKRAHAAAHNETYRNFLFNTQPRLQRAGMDVYRMFPVKFSLTM